MLNRSVSVKEKSSLTVNHFMSVEKLDAKAVFVIFRKNCFEALMAIRDCLYGMPTTGYAEEYRQRVRDLTNIIEQAMHKKPVTSAVYEANKYTASIKAEISVEEYSLNPEALKKPNDVVTELSENCLEVLLAMNKRVDSLAEKYGYQGEDYKEIRARLKTLSNLLATAIAAKPITTPEFARLQSN